MFQQPLSDKDKTWINFAYLASQNDMRTGDIAVGFFFQGLQDMNLHFESRGITYANTNPHQLNEEVNSCFKNEFGKAGLEHYHELKIQNLYQHQTGSEMLIDGSDASVQGVGKDIIGTNHSEIKPTQDVVNLEKVADYVKRLQAGETLEPIQAVEVEGKGIYITNGHHRYVASQQAGIAVEIRIIQSQGPIGIPDWSSVEWKGYISESQFWGD